MAETLSHNITRELKQISSFEKNVQDKTSLESNYVKTQDGIPQVYLPLLYGLMEECEIPQLDEYIP